MIIIHVIVIIIIIIIIMVVIIIKGKSAEWHTASSQRPAKLSHNSTKSFLSILIATPFDQACHFYMMCVT